MKNLKQKEISDNQKIILMCDEKLRKNPNHIKTLLLRSNMFINENELAKAEKDAFQVIQIDASNPSSYYLLGLIAGKKNNFPLSIECFTKSIAKDPNNIKAYFSRASAYNYTGQYLKANDDYYKAIEIDTNMKDKRKLKKYMMKEVGKALEIKSESELYSNNDINKRDINEDVNNYFYTQLKKIQKGEKDNTKLRGSNKNNDSPNYNLANLNDYLTKNKDDRTQKVMDAKRDNQYNNNEDKFDMIENTSLSGIQNTSQLNNKSYYSKMSGINIPNDDLSNINDNNDNNDLMRSAEDIDISGLAPGKHGSARKNIQDEKYNPNNLSQILPSSKKLEKWEVYHNQGYEARKNDNFPLAIDYYTKAINLNPKFFKAYFNRGFAFDKLFQYDSAIQDYSKAIELNPNSAYAYYNRAISYDKKGDLEKTLNDFSTAIRLLPTKVDFYLNRAFTNRKMKNFQNAINDYNQIIQLEPNNTKAFYNRGLCFEKIGQYDKAEKDLETCLNRSLGSSTPEKIKKTSSNTINKVNIYYHLANIREKLGKTKDAMANYLSSIELDPNYAQPYHGLGLLMDKLGKFDEAINYFSKSISLDENNAVFWHNRGCTYRNLGNLDCALRDMNKAIELEPANIIFYDNRAYLWRKLEKYDNAINDYCSILRYQNTNYKALINRAFCYAKMEKFDLAIKDYTLVLENEPENTHALYNRAISLDKNGMTERAIADFGKIIEIEPMNANAYLNRGCCYEKIQNFDLAFKDYEASLLIDKILGKETQ